MNIHDAFARNNNSNLPEQNRCNRLRCPLARLCGLQCYNMGHNGHGINLYSVIMTIMDNLHVGGQSSLGHLSLLHQHSYLQLIADKMVREISLKSEGKVQVHVLFSNFWLEP